MSLKTSLKGLFAATCLIAGSAQAFTVDFANIADTEGEAGFASWSRAFSGITLTATGTSYGDLDNNPDYYAYLDAGNAGLGVCKVITNSAQCSPSSDDNVTLNEVLTIGFDSQVTISNLFFRNGSHGTTFANNAEIEISIDNGAYQAYSLVSNFNVPLTGSNFRFVADTTGDGDQFYISSLSASGTPSVPAPTPLALLGIAFVGLGWHKRKQR